VAGQGRKRRGACRFDLLMGLMEDPSAERKKTRLDEERKATTATRHKREER
jgi:hypothetical protein